MKVNIATLLLCFCTVPVCSLSNALLRMFTPKDNLPSKNLLQYPKLAYSELTAQEKYDLQWYVIGRANQFS
jgi:hypothetical protein